MSETTGSTVSCNCGYYKAEYSSFSVRALFLKSHFASVTEYASSYFSPSSYAASASPFEGLAERMNWLKVNPEEVS